MHLYGLYSYHTHCLREQNSTTPNSIEEDMQMQARNLIRILVDLEL
jgi:hypothetical protein